jgi:hypothetical protein
VCVDQRFSREEEKKKERRREEERRRKEEEKRSGDWRTMEKTQNFE